MHPIENHFDVNAELIAFLREHRKAGRPIILVTAAARRNAEAVAKFLNLFDEIISSDGTRNLKGEAKSRELVERFGHKGFDYAGNAHADLPVWREADCVIIVNASCMVTSKARRLGRPWAEFSNKPPVLSTALRAMRPHQWVQNLLVFVPFLTSMSLYDSAGLFRALCVFTSFCRGVVSWAASK